MRCCAVLLAQRGAQRTPPFRKQKKFQRKETAEERRAKEFDVLSGDPDYKNFSDLLLLPSRTEEWVRRQEKSSGVSVRDEGSVASRVKALVRQAHCGDVEGAQHTMSLLRSMPDFALELRHLNHLMIAAAHTGDCEKFEAFYEEALERGLGSGDQYTFSAAIKCYMRAGRTDEALGMIERAKKAGVVPNEVMYGALLSGFAQAGQLDSAEAVWNFVRTSGMELDSVLFTSMIHACAKAGHAERALLLLNDMKGEGFVPTEVTYNATLYALARRLDMWQDAKNLFETMIGSGMEPTEHTMNTMLLSAARSGDHESCRGLVQEMRAMQSAGRLKVSRLTLNTQLSGLARALKQCLSSERGDILREAVQLYSEIDKEFGVDFRTKCALLNVYTLGHFLERATTLFAELKEERESGVAYTMMLKMWCETGRPKELEQLWLECKEKKVEMDTRMYAWVINGFARSYWLRSAIEALRDMVAQGLLPSPNQHLKLLRQRCSEPELDLRKHRAEMEAILQVTRDQSARDIQMRSNKRDLFKQKLEGDGVRPFLLPRPLFHKKEEARLAKEKM